MCFQFISVGPHLHTHGHTLPRTHTHTCTHTHAHILALSLSHTHTHTLSLLLSLLCFAVLCSSWIHDHVALLPRIGWGCATKQVLHAVLVQAGALGRHSRSSVSAQPRSFADTSHSNSHSNSRCSSSALLSSCFSQHPAAAPDPSPDGHMPCSHCGAHLSVKAVTPATIACFFDQP